MHGRAAIVARGVSKRFGALTAIDALDLVVPAGACVGLLGPNGAGKTTLMRLLTGQAVADEGHLEVFGLQLPSAARAVRRRCGVVPQEDNLDDELTVAENLQIYAMLHGISRSDRPAVVHHALAIAQLTDRADTRTDELSGGMRRRLLIARGTLHRPQLVLLDEPTVGLDPQIRFDLWTHIDTLRETGTTVVVSTHYMEEAERLCDLVVVVHDGRLAAYDSVHRLIATHIGGDVIEMKGSAAKLAAVECEARKAGLATRRARGGIALFGVNDGHGQFRAGVRRPANLEDVFVKLTGARLE